MQTEWQINDYIPDPNTGKDRWQIHKIFKGGMGVIYIVYDTEWREAFAVKTYQDRLQNEYAKEQFKKEALVWINLDRHENIARALMVENIQNRLYIFLEYVPGGDLSRWIGTKRLDLKQVLLFALQFCYGMEHALAKGVKAHRDIKPQNCLITEDGTLKITDFGLAKAFDADNPEQVLDQLGTGSLNSITTTRTGQVGGTLPYMAPEQFEDLKRVDVKADIYAFGIMLYEMICGHRPFEGSSYTEFRKKHHKAPVPDLLLFSVAHAAPLADIARKCLAKNPYERYADFSHLRRELAQLYETVYAEEAPLPKKAEKLSAIQLYNKGLALGNLGRYEEAISCYNHTLEIDPKYALALSNKGIALGNSGRYKEAITCYDHALAIDPKYADAWYNKGNALVNLKRYEEAITCYSRALDINPKDAEVWSNKGGALASLERYQEAIIFYDQALEIDPKLTQTWNNKGRALGELGRHEEAITCFDSALEIAPKLANVWYHRGIALTFLMRLHEALTCFQRAHQLGDPLAAQTIEFCQQLLHEKSQ